MGHLTKCEWGAVPGCLSDAKGCLAVDVQEYATAQDMMQSTCIKAGYAHTLGFYEVGDGGAAYYTVGDQGEPNGMDVLRGRKYVCKLVPDSIVKISQLGGSRPNTDAAPILQHSLKHYPTIIDNDIVSSEVTTDFPFKLYGLGKVSAISDDDSMSFLTISSMCIIEGLTIENFKNKGINLINGSDNSKIMNCKVNGSNGSNGAGISIYGNITSILIDGCATDNCRIGITSNGGNNITVTNCIATNFTTYGIGFDGMVSNSGDGCKNSIIADCIAIGNKQADSETPNDCFYFGNGSVDNTISDCVAVDGRWGVGVFNLNTAGSNKGVSINGCVSNGSYGGFYCSTGAYSASNCICLNSVNIGFPIGQNCLPCSVVNCIAKNCLVGCRPWADYSIVSNLSCYMCETDLELPNDARFVKVTGGSISTIDNKSSSCTVYGVENYKFKQGGLANVPVDGLAVNISTLPSNDYIVVLTPFGVSTPVIATVSYKNPNNFFIRCYNVTGEPVTSRVMWSLEYSPYTFNSTNVS